MSDHRSVILLGGGGHAAVVADAVRSRGWAIIGYLDDRPPSGSEVSPGPPGLVRLGAIADLRGVLAEAPRDVLLHAAVGEPSLRREWLDLIGTAPADPIIHITAVISPSAVIDAGTFVGPLAVVNARAQLARGVIVNSGAIVEHDCVLGEFCHVAPRATLAGSVTIGSDALIGAGASVRPGTRIGQNATVGVGAAVVDDVPSHAVVVGVPARRMSNAH